MTEASGGVQPWMSEISAREFPVGDRTSIRVGLSEVFTGEAGRDLGFVREAAPFVEQIGFDTLWMPEHVVWFSQYAKSSYPYGRAGEAEMLGRRRELGHGGVRGLYDTTVLYAAVAMLTERIRLGSYVVILPQRNPVVFARQVATLDHLSNGRVNVGVGIGWAREEYEALGVPYERRGERMDDSIRAMRSLWTQEVSEHRGEFTDFSDVLAYPKPIQDPHPPIYIAGQSRRGLRRVAELGNGMLMYDLHIFHVAEVLAELDSVCVRVGRDRSEIRPVVGRRNEDRTEESFASDAEFIAQCAGLGVSEVVCSPRFPRRDWFDDMERYARALGLGQRAAQSSG